MPRHFLLIFYLTPLHLAVQTKNIDLVRSFVGLEKTDLNCPNNQGDSALHIAVKMNSLEIVRILCSSNRIDRNFRDHDISMNDLMEFKNNI